MPRRVEGSKRLAAVAMLAVCIAGVSFAARGIWDEGAVSLDGDMPRYLMNGVFIRDVVHDFPLSAPFQYAQRYYARYPALSLGHHPILPAVVEVPFYFLFGVSVFSARLSTLFALAVALACWFRLVRDIYDTPTAFFASLLLITAPGFISLFQVVLSEPYTLCLIIMSVYFMRRYCETERRSDAVAFAVCVVLSGYAKQLAAFMFPVYAFQFVAAFGVRRLFRRPTLLVIAAIGLCLLPLIPLTLKYSPFNVSLVANSVADSDRTSSDNVLRYVYQLWRGPLRPSGPLLILAGLSIIGSIVKRDNRVVLFLVWIGAVYAGLVVLGFGIQRFSFYWLPAFCALGALLLALGTTTAQRTTATACLAATIGYQVWFGFQNDRVRSHQDFRPAGAAGYEEAAQFVAENRRGATVLYSASVDSGYFVFFVRKHDPHREMVVLRADKLLTTSRMRRLNFEELIKRPDQIAPILQRFGVGYVVVEDRAYPDGPLRWLQQAVETSDFELRRRVSIKSTDRRLEQVTLSVYAFKDLVQADPDASLSINLPVLNDRIEVRLGDLLKPGGHVVQ